MARGQGRKITITISEHEKDVLDALTFLGETSTSAHTTGWRVHEILWNYLQTRYLDDPRVRELVEARRSWRERESVDRQFAEIVERIDVTTDGRP